MPRIAYVIEHQRTELLILHYRQKIFQMKMGQFATYHISRASARKIVQIPGNIAGKKHTLVIVVKLQCKTWEMQIFIAEVIRGNGFKSQIFRQHTRSRDQRLDFKHLDEKNAEQAIPALDIIVEKHKIKDKLFIESYSQKALKTAKGNGYFTMLWVTSLSYKEYKTLNDTIAVMDNIRNCINNVKPDAISCVSAMFPILCDSFPEQKIHFWDTPKKYTPENVEFTKKICQNENVKIVLVDYPNSIEH